MMVTKRKRTGFVFDATPFAAMVMWLIGIVAGLLIGFMFGFTVHRPLSNVPVLELITGQEALLRSNLQNDNVVLALWADRDVGLTVDGRATQWNAQLRNASGHYRAIIYPSGSIAYFEAKVHEDELTHYDSDMLDSSEAMRLCLLVGADTLAEAIVYRSSKWTVYYPTGGQCVLDAATGALYLEIAQLP